MQSPAKKIMTAIISGVLLINAGLSFAQSKEIIFNSQENVVQTSEDETSTEQRQEFWEKFRESVKPREKDPPREKNPAPEKDPPREVNPKEIPNHEQNKN